MSFINAIRFAGPLPPDTAKQEVKKRYSELLSHALAKEIANGLRQSGFATAKPSPDGKKEKEFQGGLGPKRVDVSYSDDQHGLLLGISIKSINFAPFGKNLKNRFSDLCTEAITLHMRFPYSVLCGFFAFPITSDEDVTKVRTLSTFARATKLFRTISGRKQYADPGEKFENFTMMLFRPLEVGTEPTFKLVDTETQNELTEAEYFARVRETYNQRNPHALIEDLEEEI